MLTFVRFELREPGDYASAFDLLAAAGFRQQRVPTAAAPEPLPAAVALDRLAETAAVTRAVFEALHAAGLGPVGVAATHSAAARPGRDRASLGLA